MVRFLHVADLHLGMRVTRFSPEVVGKLQQARFQALQNVRRHAAGFHFVVIAGDLFDDLHVSREVARRAFELLEDFGPPVLVLPGNHDPLQAGSVWDSPPWREGEPARRVQVLRHRKPFEVLPGVTIFPCPVFAKTSTENPTAWIAKHPRSAAGGIRIGIAHGSVMDRPNLPADDHPISPRAPDELQLDYLALGHWHSPKLYADDAGCVRMAYAGVHESMRFPGDAPATGWQSYSAGAARDDFIDREPGNALAVSIDHSAAPPQIEPVRVANYIWINRTAEVHSPDELGRLINDVSEQEEKERTLLRLRLTGTLPLTVVERLGDLRSVLSPYVVGDLDDSQLVVEPTLAEAREALGAGILPRVHDRLQAQIHAGDANAKAIAERALRLLFRHASGGA